MAISKKQILETIYAMSEEEFDDIDVLLERIMLLKKIEKAEKDILNDNIYTTDSAKQYLAKWLY